MEQTRRDLLKTITALSGGLMIPFDGQSQTGAQNKLPGISGDPVDLSEIINLADFEKMAEGKMTKMAYEFVASGAADEFTLRWNRQALDAIKLNPNVLNNVSKLDTTVTLFGHKLDYPILIAPTAFHKIMHPEGELATAKGAGKAKAIYVVSSFTTTPLEEINKVASEPLWFQLNVRDDKEFTKNLIQKAESLGYRALCITVDMPIAGARNRQARVNFKLPNGINVHYANGAFSQKKLYTWQEMEWIISLSKLPVLLKGILNPEDAEKAINIGASGIIVSNHGGRNLDTVPATIEVLPRIVERVNKRIPILMDGGIRRGTDVLKAIALGANAVLVGKAICFGLASGGAEGVTKTLEILRTEFEMAMELAGRATLASIDQSLIWR
jgi:4-hydroxymandelate oxidase